MPLNFKESASNSMAASLLSGTLHVDDRRELDEPMPPQVRMLIAAHLLQALIPRWTDGTNDWLVDRAYELTDKLIAKAGL